MTGDDAGNLCLWSSTKKKPAFTQRAAHGGAPVDSPQAQGAGGVAWNRRLQMIAAHAARGVPWRVGSAHVRDPMAF